MKLETTDCTQICLRSLARSSESRWVSVHSIQVDSGFPVKQRHTYLTSLEREFCWENKHIIWEMTEWNTERFWIENWNKVIYDGTLKSGVVWMAPVIKADDPFEQQKENSMTSNDFIDIFGIQWLFTDLQDPFKIPWLSKFSMTATNPARLGAAWSGIAGLFDRRCFCGVRSGVKGFDWAEEHIKRDGHLKKTQIFIEKRTRTQWYVFGKIKFV